MHTYPVVEAKAKFSALLASVADGEQVAISRHGKVIARMVQERPRMAADLFRPFWGDADMDLVPPMDYAPEHVPPID